MDRFYAVALLGYPVVAVLALVAALVAAAAVPATVALAAGSGSV